MRDLGRLIRVEDITSIWPHEAHAFTPWLCQLANLSQLSEAIGFGPEGLELVKTEENVGPFFADIVARDTLGGEGGLVLIENQFGRTNHDHLGKLITYAAGLDDVRTIVWIAESFRSEHRAALDWINRNTRREIAFFGVEIELWRIGESAPAPRFNVISQPNDWLRSEPDQLIIGEVTELKRHYVKYWVALGEHIRKRTGPLKPQKALPQSWTNLSIGRTNFSLTASATEKNRSIRAALEMTGPRAKLAFAELLVDRAQLDQNYGPGLVWDEMSGSKQARISESLLGADIWNEADWPRQHEWLATRLERLHAVFHAKVRSLPLDESVLES